MISSELKSGPCCVQINHSVQTHQLWGFVQLVFIPEVLELWQGAWEGDVGDCMLQTPCVCAPCARRALRCGCGGRKLSACSLNVDLIAWGRFEGVCTASSELLGSHNKLCLVWAPLVGQEPCLFVLYFG